MSENSEKGAKQPKPANPVRVVRPTSEGDVAPSSGSSAQTPAAKAPAPSMPAKASRAGAPAAAKVTPAKKAAAPVKKAAAAKPTAAPSQEPVADADAAPKRGFGDRLRSGVAKTASLAQVRGSSTSEGSTDTVVAPLVEEDGRPVRRARLLLTRIDPWSVAKVAFLLSAALGVVVFVAVLITWSVLGAAGIWDAVNSVVGSVAASSDGVSTFDIRDYVGMGRVLGLTLVVSVVNVVLLTAMATLMAYLYNMAAALLGGVEVTFSEEQD